MSHSDITGPGEQTDPVKDTSYSLVPTSFSSVLATDDEDSYSSQLSVFYRQVPHCIMLPINLKTASIGLLSTLVTGPSCVTVLGGLGLGMALYNMTELLLGEEDESAAPMRQYSVKDKGKDDAEVLVIPAPTEDEVVDEKAAGREKVME